MWTVVGSDAIYVLAAIVLVRYLGRKARAEHAALRQLEGVAIQLQEEQ